jgi:flavin-binding protein dodecin
VTEISSTSQESFEDALEQGIARAKQTIRNLRSAWVKEQQVKITDGAISEYQVNLMLTFVLEE